MEELDLGRKASRSCHGPRLEASLDTLLGGSAHLCCMLACKGSVLYLAGFRHLGSTHSGALTRRGDLLAGRASLRSRFCLTKCPRARLTKHYHHCFSWNGQSIAGLCLRLGLWLGFLGSGAVTPSQGWQSSFLAEESERPLASKAFWVAGICKYRCNGRSCSKHCHQCLLPAKHRPRDPTRVQTKQVFALTSREAAPLPVF